MRRKLEIHVMPWHDGTKYKNSKPRIKWKVVINPKNNPLLDNHFK